MTAATNPSSTSTNTAAPPADKPDWWKRSAIVMLVVAGIFGGFAFLCFRGTFPRELLGGNAGLLGTFVGAICIGGTGGLIFYFRKKQRDEQEAAENQT